MVQTHGLMSKLRMRRLFEEKVILGYDKYHSNMYSNDQSDLPRNFIDKNVHHKHTRRRGTQKYLRKSCYHRIECTAATFLAALMWRRPLNSVALTTTIHRKPGRVSDGTNTQVKAQMIEKCRIKMIQKKIYNVRDPPWKGDQKKEERILQQSKVSLYLIVINLYKYDILELKFHWYQNLLFVFDYQAIQH